MAAVYSFSLVADPENIGNCTIEGLSVEAPAVAGNYIISIRALSVSLKLYVRLEGPGGVIYYNGLEDELYSAGGVSFTLTGGSGTVSEIGDSWTIFVSVSNSEGSSMAATYPDLLAKGIDNVGRFDQFDLMAGEGQFTDTWAQAADGQAIRQFEALTYDAAGRLIPLSQSGDYATGTITVGGQPVDTETVTVNGETITFIETGTPTATQVLIGADTEETATRLRAVINSDPDLYAVTASGTGETVTLTANTIGTAGNSITIAEAVADAAFTVSGATLAGANAAEDVPSGNMVAVAMQAVDAATPGGSVPIRISGAFNHEAIVWPAGMGTLAQRRMACAGTPISVHQLL